MYTLIFNGRSLYAYMSYQLIHNISLVVVTILELGLLVQPQ